MTDGLPSPRERSLVARCLTLSGRLVGSVAEVWSHPHARQGLETFRLCVEAAFELVRARHAVRPGFLKAVVMAGDGLLDAPYALDEFADFVCSDAEGKAYWQERCPDDRFPHRCPDCGSAAYIGFLTVECKARCGRG